MKAIYFILTILFYIVIIATSFIWLPIFILRDKVIKERIHKFIRKIDYEQD